jgi:hypothetical protein
MIGAPSRHRGDRYPRDVSYRSCHFAAWTPAAVGDVGRLHWAAIKANQLARRVIADHGGVEASMSHAQP